MITVTKSNLHWNYFIALESDLEQVSRYIEFCERNLDVFSIELAHLLLSAASEVDVMAKCVCSLVEPKSKPKSIEKYQDVLSNAARRGQILDVSRIEVWVPRYGLSFTPWGNWAEGKSPDWWNSYNKVKHERNQHFDKATLRHALNATGALLVLNYLYYRRELKLDVKHCAPSAVFKSLSPPPALMALPGDLHATKAT